MKVPTVYLIAGGAVAAALAWVAIKGAKGTGAAIVSGAFDLVDGAVSETVFTVGEAVGIPRTDAQKCADAKKANNLWEVSRYCGVVDYFKQIPTSVGALF